MSVKSNKTLIQCQRVANAAGEALAEGRRLTVGWVLYRFSQHLYIQDMLGNELLRQGLPYKITRDHKTIYVGDLVEIHFLVFNRQDKYSEWSDAAIVQ